jgi:uncharacterized membrane protein
MKRSFVATANAGPEEVWKLFVDVERWPQLSPTIREVRRLDQGPFQVGSEVTVAQPRLPIARWRVTHMQPGHSFVWETSTPGVTSIGGHYVEAAGEGSIITLTLEMRGVFAGIAGALTGRLVQEYVSRELEGFRRGAESAASPILR